MRNLDTPVKQIRRKIFTEIAKIGFESTDESLKVSTAKELLQANVSAWPWAFLSVRRTVPSI